MGSCGPVGACGPVGLCSQMGPCGQVDPCGQKSPNDPKVQCYQDFQESLVVAVVHVVLYAVEVPYLRKDCDGILVVAISADFLSLQVKKVFAIYIYRVVCLLTMKCSCHTVTS